MLKDEEVFARQKASGRQQTAAVMPVDFRSLTSSIISFLDFATNNMN